MKAALVLVDVQRDFLGGATLVPHAEELVARVATLLAVAREAGVTVVHVRTTVRRDEPEKRMPHWKAKDAWRCVEGTPGHAPPSELVEREGEPVVDKTFFDGFGSGRLEGVLRAAGVDTVIVAGVHEHACVRGTALGAYERGFVVWIAEDAVGSDDPVQAAAGRRWMEVRAARYLSTAAIADRLADRVAGRASSADVPLDVVALDAAVASARAAQARWAASTAAERGAVLESMARVLESRAVELATLMADVLGKPVSVGEREVARAARLCRSAAKRVDDPRDEAAGPSSRRHWLPLGTIAAITPWNNPIAIPIGKIAPALAYGNALVMKPAPAADAVARVLVELLREAGVPDGLVTLASGGRAMGEALLEHAGIDAATVTGALATGLAAQAVCARRSIPLQAELGGNNAAIVWTDDEAEQERAAQVIAAGVFVFAGQRCTANRRVIVPEARLGGFVARLRRATEGFVVGDPHARETLVGPVVSREARQRIERIIATAATSGCEVWRRPGEPLGAVSPDAPFVAPAIIVARDPKVEVVQQETFGPVLVVQPARDFEHALALLNGVRQGLAAALFSAVPAERERFLAEAEAGILKLDSATVDADTEAPFGGWKASGVGPPEHGTSNREFFTKQQARYTR